MANQLAKSLRASMTDVEKRLWYLLRDRRLNGYKFRRQVPVGPYIADFACLSARLIVELDGGQHAEQAEKDAARDDWLCSQNFVVLRFWNNDVLSNTEGVLQAILEHCETVPPHPYPSPARGEGDLGEPSSRGEADVEAFHARGVEKNTAPEETLRRLRWRCRRGLLELDLWLERFAAARLNGFSPDECAALETLLEEADADLLAWLEGRQPAPANHARMLERIRVSG